MFQSLRQICLFDDYRFNIMFYMRRSVKVLGMALLVTIFLLIFTVNRLVQNTRAVRSWKGLSKTKSSQIKGQISSRETKLSATSRRGGRVSEEFGNASGVSISPHIRPRRPARTSKCNVLPFSPAPAGVFNCVSLQIRPRPSVCLTRHEASDVTKHLYAGTLHEPTRFRLLQLHLLADPDVHVLDVNTHYGVFGLLAGWMGCSAVFVQGNRTHADMVIASILSSTKFRRKKATVLHNVISGTSLEPSTPGSKNLSQAPHITMDDMMDLQLPKKQIIVIDIGTTDLHAFHSSKIYFSNVHIPFILMRLKEDTLSKVDELDAMFSILRHRSYTAHDLSLGSVHTTRDVRDLPSSLVWKHEAAEFVDSIYLHMDYEKVE